MAPLVSIIIPVYNCERFVAEAIRSALEQDYAAKEVIVINDGSTDGTLTVLQDFGDAIHVIDQVNSGPALSRNAGLRAARGDYIAFLDSDDVWLPGKLGLQVAHLEAHRDVGTCYLPWHVWEPDADGHFRRPDVASSTARDARLVEEMSGWIYDRLLFECELLTTTVMIRASTLRQIGEFEVGRFSGEDYDLWIRLSRAAKISRLDAIGALYRVLPTSVSRQPRAINDEYEVITGALSRFGLSGPGGTKVDEAAVRQHLDFLVYQHGYAHLRSGDPAVALRAFVENLRYRPLRPKLWIHALQAMSKQVRRGALLSLPQ